MSSPAAELHQMAAVGRLLAGIVHEINTPLGSIFSNNEVMSRALDMLLPLLKQGTPEALESAARLVTTCQTLASVDRIACERIRSIIHGLKSLSRLDGPEPLRVNLNQQLLDTVKLTHAQFRRRIVVDTDLGDLPEVECYPQMLNQVFLNLLVNAGHAIEGEGCITIRTRLESEMVHISIADTGSGMTPEAQIHAFEPGFTTKPVGDGTGLGLAISREIVEEKHGGTINFESRPGFGTIFHVRIPVQQKKRSAQ
jgi:two-component system, NtrC family, sensor kinase